MKRQPFTRIHVRIMRRLSAGDRLVLSTTAPASVVWQRDRESLSLATFKTLTDRGWLQHTGGIFSTKVFGPTEAGLNALADHNHNVIVGRADW